MRYTQIPATAYQNMQLNAGILLSSFTPATGAIPTSGILGATSGGVNFDATPAFVDLGEDVDNCPKNLMELKKLDSWDIKMSGTLLTINTSMAKKLIGAADIDTIDTTKVTPRVDIKEADFSDLWWVGDYSDENSDTTGGFVAIHMINALSTGGFKLQSGDKAKGQFAFEYTAHFSIDAQSTVPFEVYIKAGTTPSP